MLNKVRLLSLSKSLFLVGIFFLPSAPFISAILFLFCLTIIFRFKFSEIYKDKWNHPLVLAIIIMIVITLIHNVYYINIEDQIKEKIFTWSPRDSWLGLANWIPLFLIFMGFQTFLSSSEDRKVCAKYLISGSIPVLLTGFGQYFFDWHGPLYTLNNLIHNNLIHKFVR